MSYPTQCSTPVTTDNDDDVTVITSITLSITSTHNANTHALAAANVTLQTKDAIADLGATQTFIMEHTPVVNKRITCAPLKVALADGCKVFSTHECDVHIIGLPTVLTGHIIPNLSIALLFDIRVLMEAGCEVQFNKDKCTVWYDTRIILEGGKDRTTDLWTLPIGSPPMKSTYIVQPPTSASNIAHAHYATTQIAFFTHTMRTKANSIRFAHQALCSPHISTLLHAIQCSYLKGCPNLSAKGVMKYLNKLLMTLMYINVVQLVHSR
jgi:hypothetical protein